MVLRSALAVWCVVCFLARGGWGLSVLCADYLAAAGVARLEAAGVRVVDFEAASSEPLAEALARFDAVIVRSATTLDAVALESGARGKLRVVGRAGVGLDNVDIAAARRCGVAVVTTPTSSTNSVVELTLGHLLTAARSIPQADAAVRAGAFADFKNGAAATAFELRGKRLGLVGFGNIGRCVAAVATALGMRVHTTTTTRKGSRAAAEALGVTVEPDLDRLFAQCTHVSVHCSLTDETRGLVDGRLLDLMPRVSDDGIPCGAHLVNMARGGVVREDHVLAALAAGTLASYGADVFDGEPLPFSSPLLAAEGVVATPHVGAATLEAQARVATDLAASILDLLDHRRPDAGLVVAPNWLP